MKETYLFKVKTIVDGILEEHRLTSDELRYILGRVYYISLKDWRQSLPLWHWRDHDIDEDIWGENISNTLMDEIVDETLSEYSWVVYSHYEKLFDSSDYRITKLMGIELVDEYYIKIDIERY